MASVKKRIINGKVVEGVINDDLEVKIPFEHDNIEIIDVGYGKKLYVCKTGNYKTVYDNQFRILFRPKGRRQFVRYLYSLYGGDRDIYLITDSSRKKLAVVSLYMDSKGHRHFETMLDFGSFNEIEEQSYNVYKNGYRYNLVKHTEEGNLEGKLKDPIYGLIPPIYKNLLRMEQSAHYFPRFKCYDENGQSKVQVLKSKFYIHHLLTTILKDGKELQGVKLVDRNHQLVDFLDNEYSSIKFNYHDQIVNLETNGKKGAVFYSEHWNKNGNFFTFAKETEIECLYDNISFIRGNKDHSGREPISYAITELDNQKDLYHIDYKYVTGDVDWEGFYEEPYGKCVKLNKYSQDDYKYIQNGIFIGIKNKEKSIILNDYDNNNNPITLSSEDWSDIEILEKNPLKSWGYGGATLFNEPSTSDYFSAIITLKNGNKKFIQYNHRNRFEDPIITETKQFKDLSTFGDNQLLAENEDSSKDIINYFNKTIIKDYNDSSILQGKFNIKNYDKQDSRTIISIPSEENGTERYGVIENKNGGFDATQQGFKFEFDKDGFLVEDSISADGIASDNKAKQFKKTINN